jgi:microsomal dipeptidase-like Zn-dependent dipeptidase
MMQRPAQSGRVIDGPQYANWSEKIFRQMREGGVDVAHVTVAYHENFRDTVDLLVKWNERFRLHEDLIAFAGSRRDIDAVVASGRTAILLGLQNPSPIEADIGLLEILHQLGIRFMQLSYNNQSLLCGGWMEREDSGLTNMGREVVREMNRIGMVIDMSHSGERSTLEAIEHSQRPIAVSHANPYSFRATRRNKSDQVLSALAESGGIIGLSLYPNHLSDGAATTLEAFCEMVAGLADRIGVDHIGLGSDLCQDQPSGVLKWMREGRWKHVTGDSEPFPQPPAWFRSNLDFVNLRAGLAAVGFRPDDIERIMWRNWMDFLTESLSPANAREKGPLAPQHDVAAGRRGRENGAAAALRS